MKPAGRSGLIDIHIAVLLFGLAGLFGKFLALAPWTIVLGRTAFASLALAAVLVVGNKKIYPRGARTIGLFGLLGVILAIHWITFFHAIQVSSVAVGLLAFSSFPVFITWLEPYWFNEKRRPVDMVTALLVIMGLVIMTAPGGAAGAVAAGVGWGVLSGFTFAILSLLNRKWVRTYSPVVIALYQNGVAAMVLLPLALGSTLRLDLGQIGLLAILGIVCTALSHALFIRGLARVRAQLAAIIACLEPVYGILFAFVLLNEVPAPTTIAGGALILATTVIATVRRAPV